MAVDSSKVRVETNKAIIELIKNLVGIILLISGAFIFIGIEFGLRSLSLVMILVGLFIMFLSKRKCKEHLRTATRELEKDQ